MSATDELCHLLDGRGVKWRERKWGAKHSTTIFWRARGVRWHYRENQYGELRLHADGLSPAQAVEVTLGRGECHVVSSVRHDYEGGYAGTEWEHELSCGHKTWWSSDEPPEWCPWCGARVVA